MKNILLKNVKVIDPRSAYHGKTTDIFICDGIIEKEVKPDSDIKEIDIPGLHVSNGWFDMQADFKDPGFEYKEDIESGSRAAAAGGFTGVALLPTTYPVVDTKSQVEYLKRKSQGLPVQIFPMGAISEKCEGKELAELYDMSIAGAVAFTDGKNAVMDSDLLLRALMYSRRFGRLIITFPEDKYLSGKGHVNESGNTLLLGMKGSPALAEELMIARDISLAELAEAPIHFSTISTKGSVELIRRAKKSGKEITAGVAVHNLLLDDSMLSGFDSNYKVKPPLRSHEDVMALRVAVAEGVIDVIVSDHNPQNDESKVKEFELADFGIIGAETCMAVAEKALKDYLSTEKIVEIFVVNPRKILNIEIPVIEEGKQANLSLFIPGSEWKFSDEDIFSKSGNTPFRGEGFNLRPIGIINRGEMFIAQDQKQKA